MRNLLSLIISLLILSFSVPAFADTFTVNATTASDGRIGQSQGFSPYDTLECGDILIVDSEDWDGDNLYIYNVHCDTPGQYIYIKNESGKVVTIDNDDDGAKSHSGGIQLIDVRGVYLDGTNGLTPGSQYGFVINGDNDTSETVPGIVDAAPYWGVRIADIDDIVIKGVWVQESYGQGFQFQHQKNDSGDCTACNGSNCDFSPSGDAVNTGLEIAYCKVEKSGWNENGFKSGSLGIGGYGMYLGTSDQSVCAVLWGKGDILDDLSVHDTIFNNTGGRAFQAGRNWDENENGWSLRFYNNTITNVKQCGDANGCSASTYDNAIHISGWDEYTDIYGNTINGANSVYPLDELIRHDSRCYGCSHTPQVDIWNNILINPNGAGADVVRLMSNNSNNTVINNTIVNEYSVTSNNTGYAVNLDYDTGTVVNNIFIGPGNSSDISGTPGTESNNIESSSISDQYFLDCNGDGNCAGDFHLTSSSPAVDAGTASGAPATDIEGTPRPQGAADDIGAYEYNLFISNPIPEDGSIGHAISGKISWVKPTGWVSGDVYIKQGQQCPYSFQVGDRVVDDGDVSEYDPPGVMPYETWFAWKVDVNHAGGTETGVCYDFQTATGPPPKVEIYYPSVVGVDPTREGAVEGCSGNCPDIR